MAELKTISAPLDLLLEQRDDLAHRIKNTSVPSSLEARLLVRLARIEHSLQVAGLEAFDYDLSLKSILLDIATFCSAPSVRAIELIQSAGRPVPSWLLFTAEEAPTWDTAAVSAAIDINDHNIIQALYTNRYIWKSVSARQPLLERLIKETLANYHSTGQILRDVLSHTHPAIAIDSDPPLQFLIDNWQKNPEKHLFAFDLKFWNAAPSILLEQLANAYPDFLPTVASSDNATHSLMEEFLSIKIIPHSHLQHWATFLSSPRSNPPDDLHHLGYQKLLSALHQIVAASKDERIPIHFYFEHANHKGEKLGRLLHLNLVASPKLALIYLKKMPLENINSIPKSYWAPWLKHSSREVREAAIHLLGTLSTPKSGPKL